MMAKLLDVSSRLARAVDEGLADQHGLLARLVSMRSENPELLSDPESIAVAIAEEQRCQLAIAEELQRLGMVVDEWEIRPGRRNVVGHTAPVASSGRSLLLNGHVDVVPAGDHAQWGSHGPWSTDVVGGRMLGRGTSDMKGGLVAAIGALRAIDRAGLQLAGKVLFESVVDEEVGGAGTRAAIDRGYRAEAAIVLEATSGKICPVEGGLEWVNLIVAGVAGHSARRYLSIHAGGRGTAVNAIEKAAKLLAAVQEYERHQGNTRVHPLMPAGITTINPGMIAGGSGGARHGMPSSMHAYSNMADYCVIGLSFKYLPSEHRDAIRRDFEEYVAAVGATDPWLRTHPPVIEWGVSGVSMPPCDTPVDHPLVRVLERALERQTGSASFSGFEAKTDLCWLAEAGIPGVVYGPGSIEQAHTAGEFIDLEEVAVATRVLAETIVEWCGLSEVAEQRESGAN